MERIGTIVLAALFAVGGTACDAGDVEETPEAAETMGEQTMPAAEPPPATGAATEAAATLGVDSMDTGGAYLTDGQGRALYLLEGEPADSSTCYDACAQEWPPLLASGADPRAGAMPVQEGLIGTIARQDGQRQVTYAGHALYYYHDDTGPGETQGQDVTDQWGEWYLVSPAGEPLEPGEAEGGA